MENDVCHVSHLDNFMILGMKDIILVLMMLAKHEFQVTSKKKDTSLNISLFY